MTNRTAIVTGANSGRRNDAGIELQLATNHLEHFLLTSLLIGRMPDESASRVVSLSSIAHKQGRIDFDDINCERAYDVPRASSPRALGGVPSVRLASFLCGMERVATSLE